LVATSARMYEIPVIVVSFLPTVPFTVVGSDGCRS